MPVSGRLSPVKTVALNFYFSYKCRLSAKIDLYMPVIFCSIVEKQRERGPAIFCLATPDLQPTSSAYH